MIPKVIDKEKAILLRKQGKTYKEILEVVPVAKSTLSVWLREVGLSTKQEQRITRKKLLSAQRGGASRKKKRLQKTKKIIHDAAGEVKGVTKRDLWMIGIALYWAEGTKEKKYRPSVPVQFANSDPRMVQVFLKWLDVFMDIKTDDIVFDLYIHESSKHRIDVILSHWTSCLRIPFDEIVTVRYKGHIPKTKRKKREKEYYGLLKMTVRRSTDQNRKIAGWIQGLANHSLKDV